MKVMLISRGKTRHIWFAKKLQECGLLEAHFVQEHTTETERTVSQSDFMSKYFKLVAGSEYKLFNIQSHIKEKRFKDFEEVCAHLSKLDRVLPIIFGCSLIKNGPLEYLSSLNAVNIHAGVSPEFRGSACNFWALYDDRPDLVGLTLHKLTDRVDDGDIYFQFTNDPTILEKATPVEYSMSALQKGLPGVIKFLEKKVHNSFNGEMVKFAALDFSARQTVRLSRHRDFTEQVLLDFCQKYGIDLTSG